MSDIIRIIGLVPRFGTVAKAFSMVIGCVTRSTSGHNEDLLLDDTREMLGLRATNAIALFELLLLITVVMVRSQDSAVGIATGYDMDDRQVWVRIPVGSRIFSSPRRPDRIRPPPPSYPMVTGALSPRVKRHGREAHRSPPVSVPRSRKCGSTYTSPPYDFMA
jgi:hypothetical protein